MLPDMLLAARPTRGGIQKAPCVDPGAAGWESLAAGMIARAPSAFRPGGCDPNDARLPQGFD